MAEFPHPSVANGLAVVRGSSGPLGGSCTRFLPASRDVLKHIRENTAKNDCATGQKEPVGDHRSRFTGAGKLVLLAAIRLKSQGACVR